MSLLVISGFLLSSWDLSASVGVFHVDWNLVSYAVAMLTTTLYTSLVVFRMLHVNGVSTSLRTYRGIAELFVESAALYSVAHTVLLGIYAYEYYYYSPAASPVIAMYRYPKAITSAITVSRACLIPATEISLLNTLSRASRLHSSLRASWRIQIICGYRRM